MIEFVIPLLDNGISSPASRKNVEPYRLLWSVQVQNNLQSVFRQPKKLDNCPHCILCHLLYSDGCYNNTQCNLPGCDDIS